MTDVFLRTGELTRSDVRLYPSTADGSGSAYSRSTADTAGAVDTVTRLTARSRSTDELAAAADTVTRLAATSRAAADTATAGDTVARFGAYARLIADTAAAADALAALITSIPPAPADPAGDLNYPAPAVTVELVAPASLDYGPTVRRLEVDLAAALAELGYPPTIVEVTLSPGGPYRLGYPATAVTVTLSAAGPVPVNYPAPAVTVTVPTADATVELAQARRALATV